ncbi:hypothetical protein CF327_g647 [Tilletia walkeri]|uniref:Uncharacterized protein n=1 Tax=Tilletia walkeri TaxID=117179 RepID=A0A8X7NEX3_9BASI|nr:hypothetical protein CF327_g647 [Tilletia walkeri]KAE8270760.1 hypothetical protein A4X09_0g1579 [Tilletia walkeri]
MASSEPPHKKQRRIHTDDEGLGDGEVSWFSPPINSEVGGSQTVAEDASATVTSTFAPNNAHGEGSDEANGEDLRDANEYAHLLLAQAAESSARMIESNSTSQQDQASSSSAPGTSVHAHHQAELLSELAGHATHPGEHDEQGLAVGTSSVTANLHDSSPPELPHERLHELDLMLLRISYGAEPVRYGLVCKQCRTAVKPNQLAAHLTRKSVHLNFKAKTKRALISKTLTAELLDIIKSLVQEAGVDPQSALGGVGPSSLLSFEDFFGPAANPLEARPPLPSLQIRQASKCQQCLRLVSSTHKKTHRIEEHPDLAKDQVPFVIVRVQELARNGGVLFQVFEEDSSRDAAAAADFAADIAAESALMDQEHREALSSVLSAITAATPLPQEQAHNIHQSNSLIDEALPPGPAPHDDGHGPLHTDSTKDDEDRSFVASLVTDLANLPDAPDPTILSQAAAAAATAAAMVARQHAS